MIYAGMLEAQSKGQKRLALLLDPDKATPDRLATLLPLAVQNRVDYLFVGGSLLTNTHFDECLQNIRSQCDLPVVLFPGNPLQLSRQADAVLLLSLISGRNPDLLIGQHVIAAPYLRQSGLEVISTGYMLIDGGAPTSVGYISNTTPVPADKTDIAVCTALAGEMLGLKVLYLEAGSGAQSPVSEAMISAVRQAVQLPLIVGGGIRTPERARASLMAGADILVVGNGVEKDPALLPAIAEVVREG